MRLADHLVSMRWMRNAYKILVRRPEWIKHIERRRHEWKNAIKTDLKK